MKSTHFDTQSLPKKIWLLSLGLGFAMSNLTWAERTHNEFHEIDLHEIDRHEEIDPGDDEEEIERLRRELARLKKKKKDLKRCTRDPYTLKDCLDQGIIDQEDYDEAIELVILKFHQDGKKNFPNRCEQDSLTNEQAHGRIEWTYRCIPYIDGVLQRNAVSEGRYYYPTFVDKLGRPWIAPTERSAACKLPRGVKIVAKCLSSCFTPEQVVALPEFNLPIGDATLEDHPEIVTVDSQSTLEEIRLGRQPVDFWVRSLKDTRHEILDFETLSGKRLRVTPNHPMLLADGRMVMADQVSKGDLFLTDQGEQDPVVSITGTQHFGKVYNVMLKTDDAQSNIIAAQGILTGTAFFQNQGRYLLESIILRAGMDI